MSYPDKSNRVARNAAIYVAARKGNLDYGDVRDSQDAEWADNGLDHGLKYGNLKGDDAVWAVNFRQNLEADFG